jgi:hypothetical protein
MIHSLFFFGKHATLLFSDFIHNHIKCFLLLYNIASHTKIYVAILVTVIKNMIFKNVVKYLVKKFQFEKIAS